MPLIPRDTFTTDEWRHSGQTLLRDIIGQLSFACNGGSMGDLCASQCDSFLRCYVLHPNLRTWAQHVYLYVT